PPLRPLPPVLQDTEGDLGGVMRRSLSVTRQLVVLLEGDGAYGVGAGESRHELAVIDLADGDDQRPIAILLLHRGKRLGVPYQHRLHCGRIEVGSRPQDRGGAYPWEQMQGFLPLSPAFVRV